MSAIAGIFWFNHAPANPADVRTLTSAMSAQGPDGRTDWTQGSISLGHCMLRATPESENECQPVSYADNSVVLVWDGRLDNRAELLGKLRQSGHSPRDPSDAEMVLQSYVCWGRECCRHLAGDFALAVWDGKARELICIRDHMGGRPFYFTQTRDFFAFASEDEPLLALPGVSSEPNELRVASYLVPEFRQQDPTLTSLKDVSTLPPAHWLQVTPDQRIRMEAYWQFEAGEQDRYTSDIECQEAFLQAFERAVSRRLRTRGHVAAMVSGGMDSASLTSMATKILHDRPGKEFHSYSAIADDPAGCVESRCILALTRNLGANAHYLAVPSFTGMLDKDDLLATCWSQPHPTDNSILLPAMMCLAASRNGHRVMLHGMGGDQTMGVHDRYIGYLLQQGHIVQALRESLALSQRYDQGRWSSALRYLLQSGWTAFAPKSIKAWLFKQRQLHADSPLKGSFINPELADKLQVASRIIDGCRAVALRPLNLQQDQIRLISPPYGHVLGLNGYNRVAARLGIELRDPWSDRDLAEFWLRLPVEQKVRNGWRKYLTRTSFEPHLDASIIWRRGKQHLGAEFILRVMTDGEDWARHELQRLQPQFPEFINPLPSLPWNVSEDSENDNCAWHTPYDILVMLKWLARIRHKLTMGS